MQNSASTYRKYLVRIIHRTVALMLLAVLQTGCLAAAVDTAVDTTIAVAKVPFKVVGAAVDVATPDDDDEDDE